jgi:hypothetical protein
MLGTQGRAWLFEFNMSPALCQHEFAMAHDETLLRDALAIVSRAFPSWKRSILTEIDLCHACAYHEIEDGNGRAGRAVVWWPIRTWAVGRGGVLHGCPADGRGCEDSRGAGW